MDYNELELLAKELVKKLESNDEYKNLTKRKRFERLNKVLPHRTAEAIRRKLNNSHDPDYEKVHSYLRILRDNVTQMIPIGVGLTDNTGRDGERHANEAIDEAPNIGDTYTQFLRSFEDDGD